MVETVDGMNFMICERKIFFCWGGDEIEEGVWLC